MVKLEESSNALPRHVAVIMDGNGRWAKLRGLPRVAGHREGLSAAKSFIMNALQSGIPFITLFAFSTENWKRPKLEVKALFELAVNAVDSELNFFSGNSIKLRFIGDRGRYPQRLLKKVNQAETMTRDNTAMTLSVALGYSGRWDILHAIKKFDTASLSDADCEHFFSKHLSLGGLPDPDLLIRTGGEQRLSNFLLWNLAYTEIFFSKTLWPDFDKDDLKQALEFFSGRERRYGRIDEVFTSEP